MSNFNILFQSLIRDIERVLKKVFPTTTKPKYHFYLDMVFGILKSSSIILNDIAHSLNEKTTLKKVNYRLQRNLSNPIENIYFTNYINFCLSYMDTKDLTFIVDDSDIAKPYGNKFENLSLVRDGSSLKNEYVKGYLLTSVVGLSKEFKHPICLYSRVYNVDEKDYKSTNHITNEAIERVLININPYMATFIFDRGYDDVKLMNLINELKQYFIIRIRKNRIMKVKGRKSKIFTEAMKRKGKVNVPIIHKRNKAILKVSHFEGNIGSYKQKVTIIVSYLDNSYEPMILITNIKINSKKDLIKTVLKYYSRWKIEEHYRFKKVQYGLENFRVKSLTSINNLVFMLDLVLLVLSHIIERQNKNQLYYSLISVSKKIRDDVYIKYYQLQSGIKTIFTSNKTGVKNYKDIERWETSKPNIFNTKVLKVRK